MDEITKKDLLKETGISYGQLYRWKREKLIPDEWFMKRSSFTGQETYLPREQTLGRIKAILEMKERYSHEEMAAIFSPDLAQRSYALDSLGGAIDARALDLLGRTLGKEHFSYGELLFALLIERILPLGAPLDTIARSIHGWLSRMQGTGGVFYLIRSGGTHVSLLLLKDEDVLFDEDTHVLLTLRIDELATELRARLETQES